MAKKGFKYSIKGFNSLRKSAEVKELLQQAASQATNAANDYISQRNGFAYEVTDMPTRAVAFVRAESPQARAVAADTNILLKVVR